MTSFIPKDGHFHGFALIADINGFTGLVRRSAGNFIAQFVRDVLLGPVGAIEQAGGEVVAVMGDAVLGILPDTQSITHACVSIAKDANKQSEYISVIQNRSAEAWSFAPGGPSLKIGIEYGALDVSEISSRFFGTQRLIIGDAINHAARILGAESGNRCLLGPNAASKLSQFVLEGPNVAKGKSGEPTYEYYRFDLSDIWIEGDVKDGVTFWP